MPATMQPQNSLLGARASTSVPQKLQSPPQLNANAMNNSVQKAQLMGTPTSQAVSQAAANPNNQYYAEGGEVKMNKAPTLAQMKNSKADIEKALEGDSLLKTYDEMNPEFKSAAEKHNADMMQKYRENNPLPQRKPTAPTSSSNTSDDSFNSYFDEPELTKKYLQDRSKMKNSYAKGGSVKGKGKSGMSLKEIFTLLANHPELAGGSMGATGPMRSENMAKGGFATANTQGKSETHSNGQAIMSQDDDVGTYADGGETADVVDNSAGYADEKAPERKGLLNLAEGGDYDLPPPGSNSNEVADNINAKVSEGEFVFSADVTRYYGLRTLNMMQEHARLALKEMHDEGTIRAPNEEQEEGPEEQEYEEELGENVGGFIQDEKPSEDTYDYGAMEEGQGVEDKEGAEKVSALLMMACGGMAEGGGLAEETTLSKGGSVYGKQSYNVGRDNLVSPHPKGGSILQDYAKGGAVSSKIASPKLKRSGKTIPTGGLELAGSTKAFKGVNALTKESGVPKKTKFNKGGLLDYNGAINSATHQSYEGA